MARKSRKDVNPTEQNQMIWEDSRCKTGIYVRLSVEDNNGEAGDSIQNQIEYLEEYVDRNQDDFQLVKVYVDNGATGTNFDREGWQRLIGDVKTGIIQCILVKDFSRIGRNYIEVGNYLEKIFPFMGVRVVSANDYFDSRKQSFESSMLMNSLSNIVNDYYAKDISRKVVQARRTMQEKGEYTGGAYPYGYRKSDTDRRKMTVDPEAADVVKKIFEWRTWGKSNAWIANTLNALAIPSPGLYRFMNGKRAYRQSCNTKWKIAHISGILKNPVYLGHLVQGKSKRSYFKNNGKKQRLPKEEWIITENAHEPLVTKEQFDIVADMSKISHEKYHKQMNANADIPHIENPLRKKVYCAQCGCMMFRRSRVIKGIRNYYFFCDSKRTKIDAECVQTMIKEDTLMAAVGDATKLQLQLTDTFLKQMNEAERNGGDKAVSWHKSGQLKDSYEELQREIMLIKIKRQELYEAMKEKMLTKEEFEREKRHLTEEQMRCEKELREIAGRSEEERTVMEALDKYCHETSALDGKEIPYQLLDELIERIEVQTGGRITVSYVYSDMIEKWCEEIQFRFSVKEGVR